MLELFGKIFVEKILVGNGHRNETFNFFVVMEKILEEVTHQCIILTVELLHFTFQKGNTKVNS